MRKNWPHPVLDATGRDYSNCAYQGGVAHDTIGAELKISIAHSCSSHTLNDAVAQGDAMFVARIICSSTMYRAVEVSCSQTMDIVVPLAELNGAVEVTPLIVAQRTFTLSTEELADEFSGFDFEVGVGDVLAEGEPSVFHIYKEPDNLARLRSIFKIEQNPNPEIASLQSDISGPYIVVLLPRSEFELYHELASQSEVGVIANTLLLIPALVEALAALQAENEDDVSDDLMWKVVIHETLQQLNLSIDESSNLLRLSDLISSRQVFPSLSKLYSLVAPSEQ